MDLQDVCNGTGGELYVGKNNVELFATNEQTTTATTRRISNNLAGHTSLGHRPSEWNHPRGLGTIGSRSSERPGRDKPAGPEQLPPPVATDAGRLKAAQN